jgi:hypothetical protein
MTGGFFFDAINRTPYRENIPAKTGGDIVRDRAA